MEYLQARPVHGQVYSGSLAKMESPLRIIESMKEFGFVPQKRNFKFMIRFIHLKIE
jgi:hypothetical protein